MACSPTSRGPPSICGTSLSKSGSRWGRMPSTPAAISPTCIETHHWDRSTSTQRTPAAYAAIPSRPPSITICTRSSTATTRTATSSPNVATPDASDTRFPATVKKSFCIGRTATSTTSSRTSIFVTTSSPDKTLPYTSWSVTRRWNKTTSGVTSGYTRRNTSDFFIHKNLKGFLTQELDFYLKNEVLDLDELDAANEHRADGWFQIMQHADQRLPVQEFIPAFELADDDGKPLPPCDDPSERPRISYMSHRRKRVRKAHPRMIDAFDGGQAGAPRFTYCRRKTSSFTRSNVAGVDDRPVRAAAAVRSTGRRTGMDRRLQRILDRWMPSGVPVTGCSQPGSVRLGGGRRLSVAGPDRPYAGLRIVTMTCVAPICLRRPL